MNDLALAKLRTATKMYLQFSDDQRTNAYAAYLQFPTNEFTHILLGEEFPEKLSFNSLSPHGLGYNEKLDDSIMAVGKRDAIKRLENAKNLSGNSTETITMLIRVIKTCRKLY